MDSTTWPCHPMGRCSRGAAGMEAASDMETPRKTKADLSFLSWFFFFFGCIWGIGVPKFIFKLSTKNKLLIGRSYKLH